MTPIHPEGSEFSQNPQEFRKRGAVSPFVKVEFRCTQNQNKQNAAKPKKYDREPF